jgi:hypothetical protein
VQHGGNVGLGFFCNSDHELLAHQHGYHNVDNHGTLSLRPVAIWITLSSIWRPSDAIGGAWSQSPDSLMVAARSPA